MHINNNQQNKPSFTAVTLGKAPQTYYKFSLIFPDVIERRNILTALESVTTRKGQSLALDFTTSNKSRNETEQIFTLTTGNKADEPYVGSLRYRITQMAGVSSQFIEQVKSLLKA